MRKKSYLGIVVFFLLPVSHAQTDAGTIKQEAISRLASIYSFLPSDVTRSDIHVVHQSDGAFHVFGSFTAEWEVARNPGEVAQEYAHRNVCSVLPEKCVTGFHHTAYLDLNVAFDPATRKELWKGDYSYDVPLEKQREESRLAAIEAQHDAIAAEQANRAAKAKLDAARAEQAALQRLGDLEREQKQQRETLYERQAAEVTKERDGVDERFRQLKSDRYTTSEGRELRAESNRLSTEIGLLTYAREGDASGLVAADPAYGAEWTQLLSAQNDAITRLRNRRLPVSTINKIPETAQHQRTGKTSAKSADEAPQLIGTAEAPYPPQAIRQRHQGVVTVTVLVDSDGSPRGAWVTTSSGYKELDSVSTQAAQRLHYKPGQKDGSAVEGEVEVRFTFRLNQISSGLLPHIARA